MGYFVEFEWSKSDISGALNNAHQALLKKYAYLNPSLKKIGELWEQVYKVKVIVDKERGNHRWCGFVFASEQDYLAFVLRWS